MTLFSRSILVSLLLVVVVHTARAEPADDLDSEVSPPSSAEKVEPHGPMRVLVDPLATTARWGGGIRITGLSGIGALPGRSLGGEVAVMVRHDEVFGELALGRWKPEDTRYVEDAGHPVELGLDVWTVRGGWSSMTMPLRGWVLAEVGEVAGARNMGGVVSRMIMGDTPTDRQWRAVGGGFGVVWQMSSQARLVGNLEVAVPIHRAPLMLDRDELYTPDAITARYSLGLEVGWR